MQAWLAHCIWPVLGPPPSCEPSIASGDASIPAPKPSSCRPSWSPATTMAEHQFRSGRYPASHSQAPPIILLVGCDPSAPLLNLWFPVEVIHMLLKRLRSRLRPHRRIAFAASCARDMTHADAFHCDRRGGHTGVVAPGLATCSVWTTTSGGGCRAGGSRHVHSFPSVEEFCIFEHFQRFCWGPAAKC